MKISGLGFIALFLVGAAATGSAQQSTARLEVVVSSHSTGDRLKGVQVSIDELKLSGATSDQGVVVLDGIPSGTYVVRIRSLGYRTELVAAVFEPGARVEAEIDLLWKAVELDPLTVEGVRLNRGLSNVGFHDRQGSTGGVFLTSESWGDSPGVGLLSVLKSVPGVRIAKFKTRWGASTNRVYSGRSSVTLSGGGGLCWSTVYVDGVPQYDSDDAPLDLNSFKAGEIAAVEVYRGPAETPPTYSTAGSVCGVILLWTKSRLEVEARREKVESAPGPRLDMEAPVPTAVIPHS